MKWALDIEKADNGYICSWWDEVDETEDGLYKKSVVFEEDEIETGELDCVVNLLYFVKEHFGSYHSKHNRYNIEIKVVKKKEA
jgi:hypothetical protein